MIFKNFSRSFTAKSWAELINDLMTGLRNLKFTDNFACNRFDDVSIGAGEEISLEHSLGVIPSSRIIVRQVGEAVIEDGDTEWTADTIYLKNSSAADAVVSVLIFK